jgi:hypothetical protein
LSAEILNPYVAEEAVRAELTQAVLAMVVTLVAEMLDNTGAAEAATAQVLAVMCWAEKVVQALYALFGVQTQYFPNNAS